MAQPQPNATAACDPNGPPLDAVVQVDGAPVAVAFRLAVLDYDSNPPQYWDFGPPTAAASQVNTRYRIPGPKWWQSGKVVRCVVNGQAGPGAANRVRLVLVQGSQERHGFAWDALDEDPVHRAVLRVKVTFPGA